MNAPHSSRSSSGAVALQNHFPECKTVPLAQLRFGHEHPEGDINPRKAGRFDDIAPLEADIQADGILQSLLVTSHAKDEFLYVIAGNRRLFAAKNCVNITEAPVVIRRNLTLDEAIALALAEDLPKVPLHPVDRFEAFRACIHLEMSVDDIAARYGVAKRTVQQALALAKIPDAIREAWRAGEIDAKAAQIFTLAKSEKHALSVYNKLKKLGQLHTQTVRVHLCPDQGDAIGQVNFVGLDAYRAAGGEVIADLFEDRHVVGNPDLAAELAEKKLREIATGLTFDDGWSWAEPESALPKDWRSWKRIDIAFKPTDAEQDRLDQLQTICEDAIGDEYRAADAEGRRIEKDVYARGVTKKDKEKSGCVVMLDGDQVAILRGVVKPVEKKAAATSSEARNARGLPQGEGEDDDAPSGGKKKRRATESKVRPPRPDSGGVPPPDLSGSHKAELGVSLTNAAAEVLRTQPELAVLVLLTGFAAEGFNPAVRAQVSGLARNEILQWSETGIAENIARWKDLPREQLDEVLAQVAASALAFNIFGNAKHALDAPDVRAVCDLLDPEKMHTALARAFAPDDYFKRAPKGFALDAIADVCGADEARRHEGDNKTELVKFTLANISGTGWLPREFRTSHYAFKPDGAQPAAEKPKRGRPKK